MLSFIEEDKDNTTEPAKAAENVETGGASEDASEKEDGYLEPAKHDKIVKQGTMVLVALFCVSLLGLWVMIKRTTPSSASAMVSEDEKKIEDAIAQLTGVKSEVTVKMNQIVDKFYQFSNFEQVTVGELKKNPFRHDLFSEPTGTGLQPGMENLMREEIYRKSESLELWSIVASDESNSCMINDKILYEGDSIEGFTVGKVNSKSVELVSNGISVTLKMTE